MIMPIENVKALFVEEVKFFDKVIDDKNGQNGTG